MPDLRSSTLLCTIFLLFSSFLFYLLRPSFSIFRFFSNLSTALTLILDSSKWVELTSPPLQLLSLLLLCLSSLFLFPPPLLLQYWKKLQVIKRAKLRKQLNNRIATWGKVTTIIGRPATGVLAGLQHASACTTERTTFNTLANAASTVTK